MVRKAVDAMGDEGRRGQHLGGIGMRVRCSTASPAMPSVPKPARLLRALLQPRVYEQLALEELGQRVVVPQRPRPHR